MNVMPWSGTAAGAPHAPLRVTMLGIRGFPNVQGGAENHVEHLASALAELGCEVEAIVRSPYVARTSPRTWRNVGLVRLWSPRIQGWEASLHTFIGVLRAAWTRPDILHLHAIGPALFTPLARALGLRVVVTHHVLNYENEKWGLLARAALRLGERVGMSFANGRIAVSAALAQRMQDCYGTPMRVIPNGVNRPQETQSTAVLREFGLSPGRFVLMVARIDEQKRQLDLIEAFGRARRASWKLALAGGADYATEYARAVAEAARRTDGVVMLGHQTGQALAELYSHAGFFVLPSGQEGQPIAVLEALSYGCPVILSDIPAHREISTSHTQFVPVGDVAALATELAQVFSQHSVARMDAAARERLLESHDWRQIATQTLDVYLAVRRAPLRRLKRAARRAPSR